MFYVPLQVSSPFDAVLLALIWAGDQNQVSLKPLAFSGAASAAPVVLIDCNGKVDRLRVEFS